MISDHNVVCFDISFSSLASPWLILICTTKTKQPPLLRYNPGTTTTTISPYHGVVLVDIQGKLCAAFVCL